MSIWATLDPLYGDVKGALIAYVDRIEQAPDAADVLSFIDFAERRIDALFDQINDAAKRSRALRERHEQPTRAPFDVRVARELAYRQALRAYAEMRKHHATQIRYMAELRQESLELLDAIMDGADAR